MQEIYELDLEEAIRMNELRDSWGPVSSAARSDIRNQPSIRKEKAPQSDKLRAKKLLKWAPAFNVGTEDGREEMLARPLILLSYCPTVRSHVLGPQLQFGVRRFWRPKIPADR
jgi:hypothetical protein